MLGQWLFVPAERPEVTGDTVVTFRETSAASTPAVQFWYYPGEKIGKEFIYPKDQALRIAQRTGATVQTEEGPVTATRGRRRAQLNQRRRPPCRAGVVEGPGLPDSQTTAVGVSGRVGTRPKWSARRAGTRPKCRARGQRRPGRD